MSRRTLFVLALLIFVSGVTAGLAMARFTASGQSLQSRQLLDNPRVTVTEITTPAGGRREPYTRPSDQIIVFIDEADYEATDAAGQKQVRHRQPGEIVWHNKGEAAPLLVNKGKKPYRNLVIALK
ncbi:MAG: hypothetical protein ACREEM_39810 [Blastocatellia bacterium]